ncbi:hypothetical protein FACS1894199_08580 [Bacteroidia bacterium]|nr:hypothetical protein FACS1894199_08580 [Bacteroidia bacterium]
MVLFTPPYSFYLSDYISGSHDKVSVTLLNRDVLYASMPVFLRFTFKGANYSFQTKPNLSVAPIYIEPNTPYRLSREELALYFNLNNLAVMGLGGSSYLQGVRLPEGMIEVWVEVLEYTTRRLVSDKGVSIFWLSLQKPPILSLPLKGSEFELKNTHPILFQWTPQQSNVARVEYELIIKELWDNMRSPELSFAYSPEIFRERLSATSFIYGVTCPLLEAGKRYAWAVKVFAKDGMDDYHIFENEGLSTIYTFTTKEICPPPTQIKAEAQGNRIHLTWDLNPYHTGYLANYRMKDGEKWYIVSAQDGTVDLTGALPEKTYEYKVGGVCFSGKVEFAGSQFITMPAELTANCTAILPKLNLSNREPLSSLAVNEQFFGSGTSPITVMTIHGGNGVFSGTGSKYITLAKTSFRIKVGFDNIKINTDRRLIEGVIYSTYDATEGGNANMDDVFHGGTNTGKLVEGLAQTDLLANFEIESDTRFVYTEGESGLAAFDTRGSKIGYIEFSASQPATEEAGNTTVNKPVFPMTVTDREGNIYRLEESTVEMGEDGETILAAKLLGKTGGAGAYLDDKMDTETLAWQFGIVRFQDAPASVYTFDEWMDDYSGSYLLCEVYKQLYTDYWCPYKMLPPGQTDVINARLTIVDARLNPDSVLFKTSTGTEYTISKYDAKTQTYTLSVVGGKENDAQDVYALYPKGETYYNLGKMTIVSYPAYTMKVIVVPVEQSLSDKEHRNIEKLFKTVYERNGIACDVAFAEKFSYSGELELLKHSTGLLSAYNEEMKALNVAYTAYMEEQNGGIDRTATYLFVLKKSGGQKDDLDVGGFMPRKKQFGYLFKGDGDASLALSAVHEIAHGRFGLEHTFSSVYGMKKKTTTNLMDYNNGTHLAKWQWDLMHDPGLVVRVFEKDEDLKRANENNRSKITRFMYAMRDINLNKTRLMNTTILNTKDIKLLTEKKKHTAKAEYIFYDELLSHYFKEVELKIFFGNDIHATALANERHFLFADRNMLLVFSFKEQTDVPKFEEFLGRQEILRAPVSSTRKAFFVHGTGSDSDRWLEHPLTEPVLLCVANTDQKDDQFSWKEYGGLTDQAIYSIGLPNRNKAAQKLSKYVIENSQGLNEIVLIGHSHGANVALQAVNQLVEKGKTVYLISLAAPAFNAAAVEVGAKSDLQNCELIPAIDLHVSINRYEFKNPENPSNTQLTQHLNIWNYVDIVSGDFAGDDKYEPNGITENIEIFPGGEFNILWNPDSMNAHSLDAYRPQMIYQMLLTEKMGTIK